MADPTCTFLVRVTSSVPVLGGATMQSDDECRLLQRAPQEKRIEMGLKLNEMGRGGMLGSVGCPFAQPDGDFSKCPWYRPI